MPCCTLSVRAAARITDPRSFLDESEIGQEIDLFLMREEEEAELLAAQAALEQPLTPTEHHGYIEPHAALASLRAEAGRAAGIGPVIAAAW